MLTQERLIERLDYNSDTGHFKWKPPYPENSKAVAGYAGKGGVVQIEIDGIAYLAHRLVFLLEDGEFPKALVDHQDGDRSNNARSNLRKASIPQNTQNAKKRVDNKSGVKGVCYNKARDAYRVVINKDKVAHHCGYFKSLEEASIVVKFKRDELHKEFARHE